MEIKINLTPTEAEVILTLLEEANPNRFADWTDSADEPMTEEFFETLAEHIQGRLNS